MDWDSKLLEYKDALIDFAPKLAGAILVMVVGLWLVKKIVNILNHILERTNIGPELTGF